MRRPASQRFPRAVHPRAGHVPARITEQGSRFGVARQPIQPGERLSGPEHVKLLRRIEPFFIRGVESVAAFQQPIEERIERVSSRRHRRSDCHAAWNRGAVNLAGNRDFEEDELIAVA